MTVGRRNRSLVLVACLALLAMGAIAPSAGAAGLVVRKHASIEFGKASRGATPLQAVVSKKKKKKKPTVTTGTSSASLTTPASSASAAPIASASANCPGKTHPTGGGWQVAPPLTPPSSGARTLETVSAPLGGTGWTASVAGQAPPASVPATLSAYVRCESSSLSSFSSVIPGTSSVAPSELVDMRFNCSPGTHALSGGFNAEAPSTASPLGFRILVLGSRRTSTTQWTITVFNNAANSQPASVTGFVFCERDAKGRTISEVSSVNAITANARAVGEPSCAGKTHAVSGGFNATIGATTVPLIGVDEHFPTGTKAWRTGIWSPPQAYLPAEGSTLTSSVYCAKDATKKKKKKKK